MKLLMTLILCCGLALSVQAQIVRMETVLGDIDIELRPDVAPLTVANFLNYVNSGAYNGTIIHRSLHNSIIQGGSLKVTNGLFSYVINNGTVNNEYSLPNTRGTIAMAKPANSPDGASNSWFFNIIDNTEILGPNSVSNPGSNGFTVFGTVINGLEVIDAINLLRTSDTGNTITVVIDGQAFQASDLPYRNSFPSVYSESDAVVFQNMYVLDEALHINPGINGSWYNSATNGQGMFIDYFPTLDKMFMGWFTFDTVDLAQGVSANLGDANNRWITGLGDINHETNAVTFDMVSTSGGLFDNPRAVTNTEPGSVGTVVITFADCANATVDYNLTSPAVSGSFPLTRIVNDNVALCETLSRQTATSR